MYNVDKLEEQWYKYTRKKLILPTTVSLLLVTGLGVYFFVISTNVPIESREANGSLSKKHIPHNDDIATVKIGTINNQETKKTSIKQLETKVPSLEENRIGKIIFQNSEPKHKEKYQKKNLLIKFTERGDKDIAKDIKNRFSFAKDKSDSLFLAKYYYDKNEYLEAEKWALETNKIDSSIEESWLIFAKSKARQGKRVESLKVLQAFFKETGSHNAKILIDKIRRGKNF